MELTTLFEICIDTLVIAGLALFVVSVVVLALMVDDVKRQKALVAVLIFMIALGAYGTHIGLRIVSSSITYFTQDT